MYFQHNSYQSLLDVSLLPIKKMTAADAQRVSDVNRVQDFLKRNVDFITGSLKLCVHTFFLRVCEARERK